MNQSNGTPDRTVKAPEKRRIRDLQGLNAGADSSPDFAAAEYADFPRRAAELLEATDPNFCTSDDEILAVASETIAADIRTAMRS